MDEKIENGCLALAFGLLGLLSLIVVILIALVFAEDPGGYARALLFNIPFGFFVLSWRYHGMAFPPPVLSASEALRSDPRPPIIYSGVSRTMTALAAGLFFSGL